MEWDVPGSARQSKEHSQERCLHEIFIMHLSRPLYLESDASGVSLGDRLSWVRDGLNCGCDKVPDNETLYPTASTSKSLSSAEWCYNNM